MQDPKTVTFVVYEHEGNNSSCIRGDISVPSTTEHVINDDDTCPMCEEELMKTDEVTVSNKLPDCTNEDVIEFINDSTPEERAVYLAMVLESLSTTFTQIEGRLSIVKELLLSDVPLSDETCEYVESKCCQTILTKRAPKRDYDGVGFGMASDKVWNKIENVNSFEESARLFSTHVPNDKIFDNSWFNNKFN